MTAPNPIRKLGTPGLVWAWALGALALVIFGPLLLLATPLYRLGQVWWALLFLALWALFITFVISFLLWSPDRVLAWLERRLRRWVARFSAQPADLWLAWARQAHHPDQARWCLAQAAKVGSAEALFQEGLAFLEGGFGPSGQGAAVERLLQAARRNHAEAAFRLAETLRTGAARAWPEAGEAERWYQRSARLGFGPASAWLAQAYALGDGVIQDAAQAQAWSALAERQQPFPALSHSVLRHDAAPEDPLVRLTAQVATEVNQVAGRVVATRLGRWGLLVGVVGLSLAGLGLVGVVFWSSATVRYLLPVLGGAPLVLGLLLGWQAFRLRRERPRAGRDRLLEAATAGDPEACYRLGLAYQTGSPARLRDDLSAGIWLRKAAEAGHREAMVALSAACLGGHGMLRDPREAARWAEAARANQLEDADAR